MSLTFFEKTGVKAGVSLLLRLSGKGRVKTEKENLNVTKISSPLESPYWILIWTCPDSQEMQLGREIVDLRLSYP